MWKLHGTEIIDLSSYELRWAVRESLTIAYTYSVVVQCRPLSGLPNSRHRNSLSTISMALRMRRSQSGRDRLDESGFDYCARKRCYLSSIWCRASRAGFVQLHSPIHACLLLPRFHLVTTLLDDHLAHPTAGMNAFSSQKSTFNPKASCKPSRAHRQLLSYHAHQFHPSSFQYLGNHARHTITYFTAIVVTP